VNIPVDNHTTSCAAADRSNTGVDCASVPSAITVKPAVVGRSLVRKLGISFKLRNFCKDTLLRLVYFIYLQHTLG